VYNSYVQSVDCSVGILGHIKSLCSLKEGEDMRYKTRTYLQIGWMIWCMIVLFILLVPVCKYWNIVKSYVL